ncbi:MjaI family restriction endonuclease [Salinimicrobium sp. TIG7-5_MAKvit]|uniref:MjaI family restriction endonuclease n=1 Tax=Salinimicrobium sp. TIG7-5_MAKvit TaxID=3121289 RepID=UPI003C6E7CF9
MKVKIKNAELHQIIKGDSIDFPKYATQLINLANSNAQGTRPRVVGQMSDLIQEFGPGTIEEWEEWYGDKKPDGVENAVARIFPMVENLKVAIAKIDESMVRQWVEDLVITKTYLGLRFQEAILSKVAEPKSQSYRLATPEEEARGIDGFINDEPVSIKPITYKVKNLSEEITFPIIFYDKKKDGITIEIPDSILN